jgi:DMSO reductase family type II enzyme heme b subunit
MKVSRQSSNDAELADGRAGAWLAVEKEQIVLVPSPIGMTAAVSPYMSKLSGHGKVDRIGVQMVHNGATLSIRLSWDDPDKDDKLNDLDQFADGVAIMFPLLAGASALTMGSSEKPVNAWLWLADQAEPFDVLANGYATSQRRSPTSSGLLASSYHENDTWTIVFQRPLKAPDESYASIEPGTLTAFALAVWEGSNRERSAQKSVSGDFVTVSIAA